MRKALVGLKQATPMILASLTCLGLTAIIGVDVVVSAAGDFPGGLTGAPTTGTPTPGAPTAPSAPKGCLRMPDGLLICDSLN